MNGALLLGAAFSTLAFSAPAIAACTGKAPAIAEAASGRSVARSSHMLRNPDNAPGACTAAGTDDFVAREAAGEAAETLAKAEIGDGGGPQAFRCTKAIPTGEPCPSCHGGDTASPGSTPRMRRAASPWAGSAASSRCQ